MSTARERHPHAYVTKDDDPRKRSRVVPMEVLSCGYSRTGTMTLRKALETLGYPTWHWVEQGSNPPDMDLWSDALLAKFDPALAASKGIKPFGRVDFDCLLSNWSAATDQPPAILCEELLQAYPDAKVILHERNEDDWYRSFSAAVIDGSFNPWIPLCSWLDPVFMKRTCYQTDLLMKYYFRCDVPRATGFWNNEESKRQYEANAKETYRRHNEMVKRVTPKDKLLLWKFDDGWEPLCNFLNKPVPDVPFPRVNETAVVQELIGVYITESYKRAGLNMLKRATPLACIIVAIMISSYGRQFWMNTIRGARLPHETRSVHSPSNPS